MVYAKTPQKTPSKRGGLLGTPRLHRAFAADQIWYTDSGRLVRVKQAHQTPQKVFVDSHQKTPQKAEGWYRTPMKDIGDESDQNSPMTNPYSPVPGFQRPKPAGRRRNWEDRRGATRSACVTPSPAKSTPC